jgi:hypothetical protein
MYRVNQLTRQQQATARNVLERMALADGHHPAIASQNRQNPVIPGPRAIKNMLKEMLVSTTDTTTEAAAPVEAAATVSTTNTGANVGTTAADANAPATTPNDEAIPMANFEMMPPLPPIPPPINDAHVYAL